VTSSICVAIVGCGRMGAERAACAAESGATIAYCADSDGERARTLASRYESHAVTDMHAIPWRELQAVFVCTPPSTRSVVLDAVAAGVAVLVEKPIGLSEADGALLASAVEKQPIINAVGYMNRYRPSVLAARAAAAASTVSAVAGHWASKRYAVPWWGQTNLSGGPFNEQATHLVDLVRFVVGEIADVCAFASPIGDERDISRAAVAMRFKNGAVGTLAYSCEADDKHIGLHVMTGTGAIELRGWNFALAGSDEPDANPFMLETKSFIEAVSGGDARHIRSDFADATKTQRAVDLIRRRFAEGMADSRGSTALYDDAGAR
jgi:myo-inositol 2-dehydrogenase/D-chiro-inositol 1-dehydrogenase